MPKLPKLTPKTRKNRPAKIEIDVGGQKFSGSSEDIYQARRRYTRAGERYEKQAAKETGAQAERLRLLADDNYKRALATYENKEAQARFAAKHNLPVPKKTLGEGALSRLVSDSSDALESVRRDPERRRKLEAKTLMRGPVGSRIMAATKDIWYDPNAAVQDMSLAYRKIMQTFGVTSMEDVIKRFQDEMGEDLYKDVSDDGERYARDSQYTIQAQELARQIMRDAK